MKLGLGEWQWGKRVHDARGATVVVRHTWWWTNTDQHDRAAIKREPWMLRFSIASALFGGVMGVTGPVLYSLFPPSFPIWLSIIVVLLWAMGMGVLFSQWSFRPMLVWWTRRRLDRGRCGGCTFALYGLIPEPDGCTVCPECGAAWRLPSLDA